MGRAGYVFFVVNVSPHISFFKDLPCPTCTHLVLSYFSSCKIKFFVCFILSLTAPYVFWHKQWSRLNCIRTLMTRSSLVFTIIISYIISVSTKVTFLICHDHSSQWICLTISPISKDAQFTVIQNSSNNKKHVLCFDSVYSSCDIRLKCFTVTLFWYCETLFCVNLVLEPNKTISLEMSL